MLAWTVAFPGIKFCNKMLILIDFVIRCCFRLLKAFEVGFYMMELHARVTWVINVFKAMKCIGKHKTGRDM